MLWKGYQAYEASWEPEDFILPRCIELYWRPRPDLSLVRENIVCFRIAVERHLKSQSRLPVRIFLRGDVFRFLLAGKGVSRQGWLFFEKNDFPLHYFPLGWDSWVDSHGQGMKVFYPMKVKTFISWSPKKYGQGMDGVSFLLQRAFQENITFNFTKVSLQDSDY